MNPIARTPVRPTLVLRKADIAQSLSVSKTPGREALDRLEWDGLVELSSFRSAVVTDFTARDLQENYEFREVIEVAAARSAAESMSDEGLARLGRIACQCARLAAEGGGPELVRLISEFDSMLFEEVRNTRIRAILNSLTGRVAIEGLTTEVPSRPAASVHEQAQIYESIQRRASENAERFMRRQIRSARGDQLRALPAPSG